MPSGVTQLVSIKRNLFYSANLTPSSYSTYLSSLKSHLFPTRKTVILSKSKYYFKKFIQMLILKKYNINFSNDSFLFILYTKIAPEEPLTAIGTIVRYFSYPA